MVDSLGIAVAFARSVVAAPAVQARPAQPVQKTFHIGAGLAATDRMDGDHQRGARHALCLPSSANDALRYRPDQQGHAERECIHHGPQRQTPWRQRA